ncbi:hypothetical protein H2199_006490 [Coniosporium tulheliwenetii]|uniref:Uncharacterized protein n=1 Tax=Coniosporium tulheliwenetii TaxID=3383036 RepID=A0ACC2YWR6_9PEZI|nr:hypothetical protein H2199_006490 [Cladosporium sp. JES 115]
MVTTRRGLDTGSPAASTSANKPLPATDGPTIEITARTAAPKRKVELSAATPNGAVKRRKVHKIHARAKSNGAVHEKQTSSVEEDKSNESASVDGSPVEDGTAADTSNAIRVRPKSPEIVIEATARREEHPEAAQIPSTASASTPEQEPMYEHLATPATVSVYATPATTLRTTQKSPASRTPVPEVPSSTMDSEMTEEAPTPQPTKSRNTFRQPTTSSTISRTSALPKASTENTTLNNTPRAGSPSPSEPIPKPSHTTPKSSSSSQPSNADLSANSDGASDDEAPETITTASALAAARAREDEAARGEEGEEEGEGERERAKTAAVLEEDVAAPAADDAATALDLNNLPALLPDALLAAAPEVRPPTPPPPSATQAVAKKPKQHHRFLDADEKPQKDLKRGPVNVRVLQQTNKLLAPKASANSRNLREAWLKGRTGLGRGSGKGMVGAKMERRAKKGGFLVG